MADGIRIGNLDISSFKVGSSDCKVYLGDTLLYPTTPGFQGKWLATYSGGTTSSAECDTTSAITSGEITKTNLVSIEIGDCVTSIGENAFMNCGSLTSITIPDSVTTIGNTAFLNDSSITSIDIPSGVTNIGEGAFLNCGGLTGITVNATTPPTLGNIAFANTNNCPIYVPAELVATYKSSWSGYASRILAIPTPTLQWVTFSDGDTIPSDLQIYGIKGIVDDLSIVFGMGGDDGIYVELDKGKFNVHIGGYTTECYNEEGILSNTSVEYTFSNIGCSDSYTVSSKTIANMSNDIQLYIYA